MIRPYNNTLAESQFHFVDPITRQINPDANLQNCSERMKNLFQLDEDQADSRYTLTPSIVQQDQPATFGHKQVTPVAAQSLTVSHDAGTYTRSELRGFRDSMLINAASKSALEKFSRNLVVFSSPQEGSDGINYNTQKKQNTLWTR